MADKILGFKIEITGSAKQEEALKKIETALKKLNTERKKLEKQNAKNLKSVKALTVEEKQYAATLKQLEVAEAKLIVQQTKAYESLVRKRQQIAETNAKIKDSIKLEGAEQGSIVQLTIANKRLRAERDRVSTSTAKGRARIQELNSIIDKNSVTLKKNQDALSQQKIGIGKYSQALAGLKGKLLGAAGVVGGFFLLFKALRDGAKTIANFDSETRRLASILGTVRENTKALNDEAKLFGSLTKFTATEVTGLQIELAKLGLAEGEIRSSTRAILDFATATGAELPASAKVAAVAMRVFNKDATEMEDIVAALSIGTTKSALAFEDYETILSTVGPVARSYNFSLEDTIGLTGKLRDAGFDASKAATATRNILLNLADSNGALAKSLGRPVRNIEDLVGGLKELNDRGVSLAETLELTDKRSVSAFNQFLIGADSVLELKDSVTGANEALRAMVEEQMKSLTNQTHLLKSAWKGFILGIEDGDSAIAKLVVGSLGTLTDALTQLSNLDLILTKTSKLTEDQLKRTFDVLDAQSVNKKSKAFQGVIAAVDQVNFVLLKLDKTEKEHFLERLRLEKFTVEEANLLWQEYYRRREAEFANDVTAREAANQRKIDEEAKTAKILANELLGVFDQAFEEDDILGFDFDLSPQLEAQRQQLEDHRKQVAEDTAANQEIIDAQTAEVSAKQKAADDLRDAQEIENEKKKQTTKQAILQAASRISTGIFDAQFNKLQTQQQAELEAAGDNEAKKEEIRIKYAKKEQKLAIKEALIQTALVILNALQTKPFVPAGLIAAGGAAIAGGIQIAAIKKNTFADGGKVQPGNELPYSTPAGDNTPALLKPGEVVLNATQQSALGGDQTFKKAGVPGFAAGGRVAGVAQPQPGVGSFDMTLLGSAIAQSLNDIKVVLNVNELNSANADLDIVNQTNAL